MNSLSSHINELRAAEAFSKQALVFDQLYSSNAIIRYKRKRVRTHMLRRIKPESNLLELNAGTGEDAIYFAQKGYKVHATDISEGMLEMLNKKLDEQMLTELVSTEQCSFSELELLKQRGPYDAVYSNFGGLNCTGELQKVLSSLDPLIKPGGVLTMVIISPFCMWEFLLMFRGRFKTAFRRFFSGRGRKARVEGTSFTCWYYSSSFVKQQLHDKFDLIGLEGLCTLVPPSYIEGFAEKHPKAYEFLRSIENRWKNRWPWKYWGDYYIISFRKKIS
jgi:ubiquinone/menaquinone biosynthesis C-methylase UbiE